MDVTYFESVGRENTDKTLDIAKNYAQKHKIGSIVVASTTGFTAEKAAKIFKETNLIIVTHVTGFLEPDHQQFSEKLREKLEKEGVNVLTTSHVLGGINRLVEPSTGSIIAKTLRMFSQGVKVAVEIAAMAADAGHIKTNEDVLIIAGTGKGADTVLLVRASTSRNFFDIKIKKILAKPI